MSRYREGPDPLVIVRAEGSRLFDADGRGYLDGNASWWSSTLGHAHPRLLAALRRQSESLGAHGARGDHARARRRARRGALPASRPPGLEHVFFSDDGSTAVEVALKLSLQYWAQNGRPGRRRFVALEDAFHGETLGATAIGGVEAFRRPFEGALLECSFVAPPREPGSTPRAVEALARIARRARGRDRRAWWSSRCCKAPPACAPTIRPSCAPRASCATATTCS